MVLNISEFKFQVSQNMEWVGEFKVNLNTCIQDDSDYIFSAVDIQYDEIPNAELVLEILEDEEVVYRKTSPFNRFLVAGRNQGPVYVAIDGSDCTFDASNMVVKAYVWNLDKSAFGVRSISLWSEKGNPIKYALEQDF